MKRNFLILLSAILLMGSTNLLQAQTQTLSDVTKFNPRYFNAIKDNNNTVAGYYIFFKTDKAPKGMADFKLNIYDPEFNLVISKKMTEPKHTRLLSTNSNGSSILFRFFDIRQYKMKYKGYDFEGNLVITKSRTISDKYEKGVLARPNPFADYTGVLPIPGYGFAEYSMKKLDKVNYQIQYFPEIKGTRGWTKTGKTGMVETAKELRRLTTLSSL